MTAETRSFICHNDQCQSKDTLRQNIIQYEPHKGLPIKCEWCNSTYVEEDDKILFKAVDEGKDEMVFDSMEVYKAFTTRYDTVKIYFPKLIIKGIHEPAFDDRILSFSKCTIDELIIEDIDITSAFYPISFSECKIKKISIRNGKIRRAKIKDFYSSWSFFGINLFKTQVTESFSIEDFKSNMMVTDCQILCPINISKKCNIELVLLHNTSDPEIIVDKSSKFNQLFEVTGKSTEVVKNITSTGKTLKGLTIDELIIDPSVEKQTIIEDCSIRKLSFPEDGNINAELYFTNCYIESIQNHPHCFEKDVVFLGCTFKNELALLRARYKQSLVLEACMFHKKVILNDLKIEKDLHLSFSYFKENLHVSLVDSGGFFTSHFAIANDGIQLDNMHISRDINFRNVATAKDFIIKNNDILGNFFLKRINVGGKLALTWVNANDLSLDDMLIHDAVSIENCYLKGDFFIDTTQVAGEANLMFVRINGKMVLRRSLFEMEFKMEFCESMMSIFTNNNFEGNYIFSSGTISNLTYMQNSRFWGNISLDGMHADEFNFNYNYVLESFEINNAHARNLRFNDNLVLNNFEVNNSQANDLIFKSNQVNHKFEIFNTELNDIELTENYVLKSVNLSYTKANDISFKKNYIYHNLEIKNTKSNNLSFDFNHIMNSLNEDETDTKEPENVKKIAEGLTIKHVYSNDFYFNDNIVHITYAISNAEINDFKLFDNQMHLGLAINSVEADNLVFTRNEASLFFISNGSYTEINVSDCNKLGELNFNNVTTGKDINIRNTTFLSEAKMLYCKIGNDLDFTENKCKQGFGMHHCKIGSGLNFKGNEYDSSFTLYSNLIDGTIIHDDRRINKEFILQKNLVIGSISLQNIKFYSSFLVEENTVEQQFYITDINLISCEPVRIPNDNLNIVEQQFYIPKLDLISSEPVKIIKNKFNFVKFDTFILKSVLYFDQNVVQGNLTWGSRDSKEGFAGIIFEHPVSLSENRIRTAVLNNLLFKSAVCQHNNHIEAGYTLYNTDYDEVMDFSGSFVGGSFTFLKVNPRDDGDLILDNTFIDKRIRFVQTTPASFSFINATFNGFEIPQNWKMRNGKLVNTEKKQAEKYLFKETTLRKGVRTESILPYSLIKSYYDSVEIFNKIPSNWTYLQWKVFPIKDGMDLLINEIPGGKELIKHRELIDECISKNFIPVFFKFLKHEEIEELAKLAKKFAFTDHTCKTEEARDMYKTLQHFFYAFYYALKFFHQHKIYWDNDGDKKFMSNYKNELKNSLREQYQVLRQIYGSNGELANEDKAYYVWMHYLNICEMYGASLWRKLANSIKYILYEKIFGWGVQLLRIVISTIAMVGLFAIIYMLMFTFIPGLTIQWDGQIIQGSDIDILRSSVFALQTTFSAVLGDWAPIGSGSIKIPMTINAVLGVLFVTFMIGAYGRKMLR